MRQIATKIAKATAAANRNDSSAAASTLIGIADVFKQLSVDVRQASLTASEKSTLLARLEEKREQAETALNEALGVTLEAEVVSRVGADGEAAKEAPKKEADAMTAVSPGQEFLVGVDFHNGSKDRVFIDGLKLEVPKGWGTISDRAKRVAIKPGENVHVVFRLQAPKDAAYTRPYWHRDDPETESVNHIDDERYVTLPFPPPVLRARVEYSVASAGGVHGKSGIGATVVTRFVDDAGKERARPLAVVPAFSVALEPATQAITAHHRASSTVALRPFSKSTPAWAARPVIFT